MNRRNFVMGAAAAMTAQIGRTQSANDRVRIAVVGCGGRGGNHVTEWVRHADAELVALCDVDEGQYANKLTAIERAGKPKPKLYTDIRKLLEDKSIDAISIASPNHWHTLQTVWACQAGKDVYVEKPCSHNIFESKQIVAAARKYNRIVQQGSQSRSSPALQEAVAKLREGEFGEVYMARGLCYKWRDTIGKTPDGATPAGVDYDLWLGPAPKRAFSKNRFHYNWHWNWDYGNGDLGNQGIHEVDIARWGLGVTHPTKVSAIGGHFMFDDDQNTPNTLTATYEFDVNGTKKMMVFEVRHWMSNHEAGINEKPGADSNTIGNLFYAAKGYMAIDGYTKYYTFLGRDPKAGPEANKGGDHFGNFLNAVRSRKQGDLNAEIEEGALSCNLVHLANMSYRLGRTLHWDANTWTVKDDREANQMLTREYRAPFVVPTKV